MTLRELNRTLLLRQMLLQRKRISVHDAVARLVALQAQYAPSPYVALWSRVEGFRKEQLTDAFRDGSIVKAGTLRTTLHVSTRDDYPAVAAAYIETQRARAERLGVDALRAAAPEGPTEGAELIELGHRVLGTNDRWDVSFALRALPFVRAAPVGPWPHTKPPPFLYWREPLPEAGEAATRVVRGYLAGYGPATREDIQQFTGLRLGQIDAALEGIAERERALRPAARAARRCGCSRSRSLPARVRLDHPRAPRPEQNRAARVRRRRLQQEERDDEEHVHGRRLRRGRVANREEAHRGRAVRAAACARRGARSTRRPSDCSPGTWRKSGATNLVHPG